MKMIGAKQLLRTLPVLCAVLLALAATPAAARGHHPAGDLPGLVSVEQLPPEARTTLQLIKQGGPYPFARDGVVFGNFEKRLPKHPRGYYHEYTVKTPGARNRGARRIICGQPTECYYSDDHYASFKRIRE